MSKALEGSSPKWDRKSNGASGLTAREKYVIEHAPKLTSALLRRPNGFSANELVDQAVEAAGIIYDAVAAEGIRTDRATYLLKHCPEILSATLLRRSNTSPRDLVQPAISTTGRIYDVVHEIEIPAEAMVSKPVDLRH